MCNTSVNDVPFIKHSQAVQLCLFRDQYACGINDHYECHFCSPVQPTVQAVVSGDAFSDDALEVAVYPW